MQERRFSYRPSDRPDLWERLKRSWRFDLTDSGRALIIGGILAAFVGSHTTSVDTYIFLGFAGVFGLGSLLATALYRPRVEVSHTFPRRAVCGESVPFTVGVQNIGRRRARDIVVQPVSGNAAVEIEPVHGSVSLIERAQVKEMRFHARFKSRGSYVVQGFRVDTTFPCGLFCLGRRLYGKSLVVVYPWFSPLARFDIPAGRRYQPGGVALASEVGDSVEYIGNREYQEGDDLRKIDWRSWARVGKPVVREYQEEYFCRAALILDTRLSPGPDRGALADFEASLSLAAAIADFLSRQEYLVDVFAAGPQIYILESGRALAHLDQILEVLACLEPCRDNPFELVEPVIMERIASLTTAIVILLGIDQARAQFLERLRDTGVAVKTIICSSRDIDLSVEGQMVDSRQIYQGLEVL